MRYGATNNVIALPDQDGYLLMVHLTRGQWMIAEPDLAAIWAQLEQGLELHDAIRAAARESDVDLGLMQEALEQQLPTLIANGMLAERWRGPGRLGRAVCVRGPSTATRTTASAVDATGSLRYRIAASLGLTIAVALARAPRSWHLRLLIAIRRIRRQRPTLQGTTKLVATVLRAAERRPGWAECFEISQAAFVAGAILGEAPAYCVGAQFTNELPLSIHMWLEADGTAVDHADQHGRRYQALIRIPAADPVGDHSDE
jgi:hypothetical protein